MSGCGGGSNAAPIPKTSNPTPTPNSTPAPNATPIPNATPTPTPNFNLNRIAFSSNRSGDSEIYTMNPDGSEVQRVTTAMGDDTKPA